MFKITTICLGLLSFGVESAMRDWMVDAALAPVVPIGKALSRVAGPMIKRTSRGIIKYDGDINSLKRNPTPFKRGSGKKNKKENAPKANPAFTVQQAKQMLNSNVPPAAPIQFYPQQGYPLPIPQPQQNLMQQTMIQPMSPIPSTLDNPVQNPFVTPTVTPTLTQIPPMGDVNSSENGPIFPSPEV